MGLCVWKYFLLALGFRKILWQAILSNVEAASTSYQLLLILFCCSMWSCWCIISICLTNVLVRKIPQAIIDNNEQGIYFRVCSTLQQLCTPRCYVVFCCGLTQLDFTHILPIKHLGNHTTSPLSPPWKIWLNEPSGSIKNLSHYSIKQIRTKSCIDSVSHNVYEICILDLATLHKGTGNKSALTDSIHYW